MTERSVAHATFTLERTYDASPARVFAAWADPAIKARWFTGPADGDAAAYHLDFRVGGRESNRGSVKGGPVYSYDATYPDIVPDERIVISYDMALDGRPISASVATVEFTPDGAGTRLTLIEHGAFLDGLDKVEYREQGTRTLLDALGRELEGRAAAA